MNTPAPLPLGYAVSEACVVYWLPDHPRRIKVHLPLGITNLVTNPLSSAFPSLTHFSSSPFGVSWDHLSDKLLTLKSLSQSLLLSNSGTEMGHPHRNTSVISPSALCSTTTAQLQSGSQLHRHCPLSHPLPLSTNTAAQPLTRLQWLEGSLPPPSGFVNSYSFFLHSPVKKICQLSHLMVWRVKVVEKERLRGDPDLEQKSVEQARLSPPVPLIRSEPPTGHCSQRSKFSKHSPRPQGSGAICTAYTFKDTYQMPVRHRVVLWVLG